MTAPARTDDADEVGASAIAEALALLGAARTVTVLCHVYPDADTLGSGLALALVLRRRGVAVQVSFAEPGALAPALAGLPGIGLLAAPGAVAARADVVVVVDAASAARLGALRDRLDGAGAVVVVDHHRTNGEFGTVNVVDPQAEATAVVVLRMLDAWGVGLDAELAHCLFAGLVTDTGCFRWAGPAAHLMAARLIGTGIDTAAITRSLLDTHPFGRLPMLAGVLGGARLLPGAAGGHGLVVAVVRAGDVGALPPSEMETVIDIVRTTEEADVAAVVKQLDDRRWSVSLRSKGAVDVAAVAVRLGGGGHERSAGFTHHGGSEDAVAALVAALG